MEGNPLCDLARDAGCGMVAFNWQEDMFVAHNQAQGGFTRAEQKVAEGVVAALGERIEVVQEQAFNAGRDAPLSEAVRPMLEDHDLLQKIAEGLGRRRKKGGKSDQGTQGPLAAGLMGSRLSAAVHHEMMSSWTAEYGGGLETLSTLFYDADGELEGQARTCTRTCGTTHTTAHV